MIIFQAAGTSTFANLSASSFWVMPQCAGEHVTLKEKHFSEFLMCIISFILLWCISCGDRDVMALLAVILSLNM